MAKLPRSGPVLERLIAAADIGGLETSILTRQQHLQIVPGSRLAMAAAVEIAYAFPHHPVLRVLGPLVIEASGKHHPGGLLAVKLGIIITARAEEPHHGGATPDNPRIALRR